MKTIATLILGLCISSTALAEAFTYQGKLDDNGSPASGVYDFRFRLLNNADINLATQVAVATADNVQVSNGIFTASVDFGTVFDGTPYWLELNVRPGNSTGGYTQLLPLQAMTAIPEAQVALSAVAGSIGSSAIADGSITQADTDGSFQQRVSGNCASGSHIRAIAADGTVTCEADSNTTYSAGTGLTLTGDTFAVDSASLQLRVAGNCTAGSAIRAIAADGTVTCESTGGNYSAGNGLTLSGSTFAADTGVLQARVSGSCTSGNHIRAIAADGTVTCEADKDTTYTAGTGLNLTGTTFAVDSTSLQNRVSGSCATGSSIRSIAADGTVTCETDSDTTYTAGNGLNLVNDSFAVDTSLIQARVGSGCAAGSTIQAIAADGTVSCATDQDTTYTAGAGLTLSGTTFAVDSTSLQHRVIGTCDAGSAISSIDMTGAVTCEPDSDTTYSAGSGLVLDNATQTFSIDSTQVQPLITDACPAGSSIRQISGTTVVCETDDGANYSAGTGIDLVGNVFVADFSVLQGRITGSCAPGSSIRIIDGNGNVTCETDDDTNTLYTAGTGLTLTGTTFAADTSVLQARVSGSCDAGSAIRSIDAFGNVTCEIDDDTTGWDLGGNSLSNGQFIGSTNDIPVEIRVNNKAVLRIHDAEDNYGTVPAHAPNIIAGSTNNTVATGVFGATISGGGGSMNFTCSTDCYNKVEASYGTIAGGFGNTVSGTGSSPTIGGGGGNTASAIQATVAGGGENTASNERATVSGGWSNTASGKYSTVPGGIHNEAGGEGSFAGGMRAVVRNATTTGDANGDEGTFVWSSNLSGLTSTGPEQFLVQADGGVWFGRYLSTPTFPTGSFLATSTGAYLTTGGTWTNSSDENRKEHFQPVDGEALLEKIASLPIQRWNYKDEDDSVKHIGPTAQAFRAAFGLGHDEKHIATVDADGVALAGVQALILRLNRERERNTLQAERIRQLATRVAEQQTQLAALHEAQQQNRQMQQRLARLESLLNQLLAGENKANEEVAR